MTRLGLIRYGVSFGAAASWTFREDCYDGPGCSQEYCPLVIERVFDDQPDVFRSFLDDFASTAANGQPSAEAYMMAKSHGIGRSSLLESIGYTVRAQIAALQYRSLVDALLEHGWMVARLMLERGLDAACVWHDPVFPAVHADVLKAVAGRIRDTGKWGREAARWRLTEFFRGALRAVAEVLTDTDDVPLLLHMSERLAPGELHERGRFRLVAEFWSRRASFRDFADRCDRLHVSPRNALLELYRRGWDVAGDVAATGNPATVRLCFEAACERGDGPAMKALGRLVEPGGLPEGVPRTVAELSRRAASLEATLAGVLVERMRERRC